MLTVSAPPRQRRKDARPQELLDAALRLFVEKGFAATRAEEVAAAAGVSKGTLYLYFPSKEELLKAAIRHTLYAHVQQGLERLRDFRGSPSLALQELLPQWWTEVYESPSSAIFKLVLTEVRNFPDIADFYVREVVEPGIAAITHVIEQGIACGEFRALDVHSAVQSLLLPMIMLCVHKHSLGACPMPAECDIDPRRLIHAHVQLVLHGLQRCTAEGAPARASSTHTPSTS